MDWTGIIFAVIVGLLGLSFVVWTEDWMRVAREMRIDMGLGGNPTVHRFWLRAGGVIAILVGLAGIWLSVRGP